MSNITNVRLFVNDPDGVFYTDNHVLDRMNEAHVEQWVVSNPQLTTASFTMTASVDIVELPSTIMIPKYLKYDNLLYWVASQADLERYSVNWKDEEVGKPKWFIRWAHNKLRVWPRPDVQYVYDLTGIGWPTEITSTSSDIGIDSCYDRSIEHQACAGLLEYARPDLAEIHEAESRAQAYNYRVGLRNQQSHNIRRLHPASKVNRAQTGSITIGRNFK